MGTIPPGIGCMPTFDFYGHLLTIDNLYPYDRVSSPPQTPAKGGGGIERQGLLRKEFIRQFPQVPIDEELVDLGKSGRGAHLGDGGALGGFRDLAIRRKLKPNPGLMVESFSRLGRLEIDEALGLFFEIVCDAGVTLITLIDRRAYTQKSLRTNKGEIHYVAAHLEAARAESDAKGYYSRQNWVGRRHRVIAMCPGWLRPNGDHYDIIDGSEAILQRIFREAESLGMDKIAARLNADGIKPFECWNHERSIWYGNHIRRLITGRAVRGEREIGHYEGTKRTKSGECTKPYPDDIISEAQWQRSKAALIARQKPSNSSGRKGPGFSNLFQSLAKCAHCEKAMKLSSTRKKGKLYKYYRCANVRLNGCASGRHSYDYAKVEFEFIDLFQDIVAAYLRRAEPQTDPVTPIRERIAVKQAELQRLDERSHAINVRRAQAKKLTNASDEELDRMIETIGINREKTSVTTEIAELEREKARIEAQAPVESVARQACDLIADLSRANDQYEARAKINTQLKKFIFRITFDNEGLMRVLFGRDGKQFEVSAEQNMEQVATGIPDAVHAARWCRARTPDLFVASDRRAAGQQDAIGRA